ncbi:hypothetical protein [Limnohabitans sp. Rim8]|uniref:hypothetical protein n=1 Tax=Limnohabitans sp. Rim8 TaxID=1100718 RepID=UPI0033066778
MQLLTHAHASQGLKTVTPAMAKSDALHVTTVKTMRDRCGWGLGTTLRSWVGHMQRSTQCRRDIGERQDTARECFAQAKQPGE